MRLVWIILLLGWALTTGTTVQASGPPTASHTGCAEGHAAAVADPRAAQTCGHLAGCCATVGLALPVSGLFRLTGARRGAAPDALAMASLALVTDPPPPRI